MIHRVLVIAAWICCGLVIASFGLFTRDQLAGASKQQTTELVAGAPTNPTPVAAVHHHGQPRRFIDAAASDLTSPFRSLIHNNSEWVTEISETILALLVYGLGLGLLARYVRGGLAD